MICTMCGNDIETAFREAIQWAFNKCDPGAEKDGWSYRLHPDAIIDLAGRAPEDGGNALLLICTEYADNIDEPYGYGSAPFAHKAWDMAMARMAKKGFRVYHESLNCAVTALYPST